MITTRRGFIAGLLAAPIIVRPGILMPVKPVITKPSALTIDKFARLYIEPAMRKIAAQLKADFSRDCWGPSADFHDLSGLRGLLA